MIETIVAAYLATVCVVLVLAMPPFVRGTWGPQDWIAVALFWPIVLPFIAVLMLKRKERTNQ